MDGLRLTMTMRHEECMLEATDDSAAAETARWEVQDGRLPPFSPKSNPLFTQRSTLDECNKTYQSLSFHVLKCLTDGDGGDPGGGDEDVGPGVVVPVHRILDGRRHRVIPEM